MTDPSVPIQPAPAPDPAPAPAVAPTVPLTGAALWPPTVLIAPPIWSTGVTVAHAS